MGLWEFAVPKNIHGLLCTIIWIKINPKGDFIKKRCITLLVTVLIRE
jgi:hypothetical protein